MTDKPEIIVAGEVFVDLIMSDFVSWPEPGKEVFAKEFRREIGGGTAITACGLAKLGARVGVLAAVGNDWGEWMIARLRESGVRTEWIHFDASEPTGFTVVATMPHDRAFLTYSGANQRLPDMVNEAEADDQLAGVRHVHLAYAPPIDTAVELFSRMRARGCSVSLDFGWREEWIQASTVLTTLRALDIFFPNEVEARHLTGEDDPVRILERFRAVGMERVVLKLGARGAGLLWNGEICLADAYPANPVDTTGAGDCFDAGFLYGWLRGEPPANCLRMANICGALSTEAYGGIAGFPTREHLEREMLKVQACAK